MGKRWSARSEQHALEVDASRRRVLMGMLASAGVVAAGRGEPLGGPTRRPRSGLILRTRHPARPGATRGRRHACRRSSTSSIYMQENHSYDEYFGMLGRGDGFTLGADGVPIDANPDAQRRARHGVPRCRDVRLDRGAGQNWNVEPHRRGTAARMDGFVTARAAPRRDGLLGRAPTCPSTTALASTFPLCDRWFCSVLAQTYPNRRFLQAGTSAGIGQHRHAEVLADARPRPTARSWTGSTRTASRGTTTPPTSPDIAAVPEASRRANVRTTSQTSTSSSPTAAAGTLPQVSFVDPGVHDQYARRTRRTSRTARRTAPRSSTR